MTTKSIFTAALMITVACLSGSISGLPTGNNLRESTPTSLDVADSVSSQTDVGDHDTSDEDEYPDEYDVYNDSDSVNLSEENSSPQGNDDNPNNVSDVIHSTLASGDNHSVTRQSKEFSDQFAAKYDQNPQISKRNSHNSNGLSNSLHDPAIKFDWPPEVTNGSVKDMAAEFTNSNNNIDSGGSEESEEYSSDDGHNLPDKRDDLAVPVPVCMSVVGNNTAAGSSPAGETSGQVSVNQVQPCVGTINTRSNERGEPVQSVAVAESVSNRGETGLVPQGLSGDGDQSRDTLHPVVIAGAGLEGDHQAIASDTRRGSVNSGVLEESRNNTNLMSNNNNNNNPGNSASNVLISENETNSSENSGLNILLPVHEIDTPQQNIVPRTGGGDSEITHEVPQTGPQHHDINDTTVKTNENNPPAPQSNWATQSPASVMSQELISPSTSSTHLSASSRFTTLPEPSLSPSSTYTILQPSEISKTRLSDEVGEVSNLFPLNSDHFTDTLDSHVIATRLTPSEVITTVIPTITPLHSSSSSLPTHTEQTAFPLHTTSSLYQPTTTSLQLDDHETDTKINAINGGLDIEQKIHLVTTTHLIEGTITTPSLSISPTSVLIPSPSLENEGNNAGKIIPDTSKISTLFTLLPSSSSSSQTLASIAVSSTATTDATTLVLAQESITATTLSTTKAVLNTSSPDLRPLVPGAVTQTTTPERESTSGNVTGDPAEPESPSSFMELKFGMSWPDFCQNEVSIRGELVQIMLELDDQVQVTPDQLQMMNMEKQKCYKVQVPGGNEILVRMYLRNKSRHFDRSLTLVCAHMLQSGLLTGQSSVMKNKLLSVSIHDEDNETPATGASSLGGEDGEDRSSPFSDYGVIAAVALASVGGCYCLGLVILQVIVRHRKRPLFIPGLSRSYSVTSSDSIQLSSVNKSRPNSGLFNPGLDLIDSMEPSNPLAFIHLTQFCVDERKIYEEYQRIPSRMPRLSVVPAGDEDKNRYANILPLVNTRVKLQHDCHGSRSSYINANYITGPKSQRQYYIATQAPTDKTTPDFWTMVWQQGCGAIVMLTQLVEDGQVKCTNYWPELVGKSAAQRHGDFLVELKQKDVHQEYIASKLEINNLREIETREIDHFWYTCWPTQGAPEPISLVKLVLDTRPKYESSDSPLVVHCSPGTGRTCTFIALDLCMRQFEERRVVDVMRTVYVMRQERAGAIQNKEQYALLYNSLNEYATIVVSPAISAASSATTLHALLSS